MEEVAAEGLRYSASGNGELMIGNIHWGEDTTFKFFASCPVQTLFAAALDFWLAVSGVQQYMARCRMY